MLSDYCSFFNLNTHFMIFTLSGVIDKDLMQVLLITENMQLISSIVLNGVISI